MSDHAPVLAADCLYSADIEFDVDHATVRLRGRVEDLDPCDIDALLELACSRRARRVIVDVNDTSSLDVSVVSAIVAFRHRIPDTLVTIDVSRLPGPRLLSMVGDLLDPSGRTAR